MIAPGFPAPPRRTITDLLPAAELRAAVLDGELQPVGDVAVPIDLPVTAACRAASLARAIGDPRVIVSDRSAAWVWGWLLTAPRLSTSVSITARVTSPERRRLGAREVVIDPDETRWLGGVAVTSPVRTLVDLARHDTGPEIDELILRGMLEHHITVDDIAAALERRPRLSYVRAARERLARAHRARGDQPLLTR